LAESSRIFGVSTAEGSCTAGGQNRLVAAEGDRSLGPAARTYRKPQETHARTENLSGVLFFAGFDEDGLNDSGIIRLTSGNNSLSFKEMEYGLWQKDLRFE